MLKTVNAARDIDPIYENGEFKLSRWHEYIEGIFPENAAVFTDDMAEKIQKGGLSFDAHFRPILNQVLSGVDKRNEAIASFERATEELEKTVINIFGRAPDVTVVLYLGLCGSAGQAISIGGKKHILLGLEKIMELNWCDLKFIYGLIYHELGHIYHMEYGLFEGNSGGRDGFLRQLFNEGIAMLFEQKLVGDDNFFHQDTGGWLAWCKRHDAEIKRDFNKDLPAMAYENQRYFGDWVRYDGRGDVGYYLGGRFAQWINGRYAFDEMIRFGIPEIKARWQEYLKAE